MSSGKDERQNRSNVLVTVSDSYPTFHGRRFAGVKVRLNKNCDGICSDLCSCSVCLISEVKT